MEAKCKPGFDGGHPLIFVLEVYLVDDEEIVSSSDINSRHKLPGGRILVNNLTSFEAPHFQISGLTPGTTYQFAAYAHNVKGQSAKMLFNVTTLNLAEKRTAETRSKVGAVINEKNDAEKESKNAFFHILTAVNMRNLKIGSFPEKTESVTSYPLQ